MLDASIEHIRSVRATENKQQCSRLRRSWWRCSATQPKKDRCWSMNFLRCLWTCNLQHECVRSLLSVHACGPFTFIPCSEYHNFVDFRPECLHLSAGDRVHKYVPHSIWLELVMSRAALVVLHWARLNQSPEAQSITGGSINHRRLNQSPEAYLFGNPLRQFPRGHPSFLRATDGACVHVYDAGQ